MITKFSAAGFLEALIASAVFLTLVISFLMRRKGSNSKRQITLDLYRNFRSPIAFWVSTVLLLVALGVLFSLLFTAGILDGKRFILMFVAVSLVSAVWRRWLSIAVAVSFTLYFWQTDSRLGEMENWLWLGTCFLCAAVIAELAHGARRLVVLPDDPDAETVVKELLKKHGREEHFQNCYHLRDIARRARVNS